MTTATTCPQCRTVMLPGQTACLRCGAPADGGDAPRCIHCGHRGPAGARFCPSCGQTAGTPVAAPAVPRSEVDAFVPVRVPRRRTYLAAVAVLTLIVAAAAGTVVVRRVFFSPEAAVNGFFDALAERNAVRALSYLDIGDGQPPEVLPITGDGYRPPAGVSVERAGDAAHRIGYDLGGERRETTVQVVRVEGRGWRLRTRPQPLEISTAAPVVVNGKPLARGEGDPTPAALPGRYTVGIGPNPLWQETTVTADVAVGQPTRVQLPTGLRAEATAEVERLVRAHVDECATRAELEPQGCPFRAFRSAALTQVRWTIEQYPRIEVRAGPSGAVSVGTTVSGRARVRALEAGGTEWTSVQSFAPTGSVVAEGGRLTFLPGRR